MDLGTAGQKIARFGLYEADIQQRVLTRNGLRVRLQDQPFQVLALLLEQPGKLVTREEIQQRLWPADTYVAFDDGLNTAIKKLRSALSDTADNPRFIETVPRRGYRFVAPVTFPSAVAVAEPAKPEAASENVVIAARESSRIVIESGPSRVPYLRESIAVALVLALGAGGYLYRSKQHRTPDPSNAGTPKFVSAIKPRPSVAVLGFRNLSRGAEQAWISTALSEMLTTELASGEELRLVPGESVARTRTNLSLPESDSYAQDTLARIRKNLDADYIVVGSYFDLGKRSDGSVRLDLRLQDAQTGETIATVSEAGTEVGLPALAARAGAQVRAKLGAAQPSPAQAASANASLPSGQEATRLYSEGLAKLRNLDDLGARSLLEKAVVLEPSVALPHVALADALNNLGYEEKAREEAEKAFDASGPLSREQRLWVEGRYRQATHEWDKAIETYRALYTFFPDNLEYGLRLAATQVSAEQGQNAIATLTELRKLPAPAADDPRIDLTEGDAAKSLGNYQREAELMSRAGEKGRAIGARLLVAHAQHSECWALHKMGQVEKSRQACAEAKQIFADAGDRVSVASLLVTTAAVLEEQGHLPEAKTNYEEAIKVYGEAGDQGGIVAALNNLAIVQRNIGNHPAARKLYEQAISIARSIGDKNILILAQGNLADLYFFDGDLAKSRSAFEDLLVTCRELGSKDRIALQLGNLGDVLFFQGDLTGAQRALEESAKLDVESGEKRQLGYHLASLGDVYQAQGRLPEARQQRLQALKIRNELGAQGDIADSQVFLADSSIEEGHASDSEAPLREAIAKLQSLKMVDDEAYAYPILARALVSEGKADEALTTIERGAPVAEKCSDRGVRFVFAIENARTLAAKGRYTEAIASIQHTLADLNKFGYVGYQMEARLVLGETQTEAGKVREGQAGLLALGKDAQEKGFNLVARKVAEVLDRSKAKT
jgi:tetratricopeptide (TPR) repeat protein/DNA-binding winged helix-turn-helix (wHTH) protein